MISSLNELGELKGSADDVIEQVEIRVKYEGYIEKEQAMADKMSKFENLPASGFRLHKACFSQLRGKQKLTEKSPNSG